MGEPVEAASARVDLTHSVDAHVDLAEDAAAFRVGGGQAEAAGRQVGRNADGARVRRDLEELRELERFAAAESDVEHAHRGQLVEDAARIDERQRRALRRRVDVAARASGRAAARQDDVHLGGRGERRLGPLVLVPRRRIGVAELAHHAPVDVQQSSRVFRFGDAAKPLGACTDDPQFHDRVDHRKTAPSKSAIAVANVAPRNRNVTSTPSELEFGLQPNVTRRTRPFRMGASSRVGQAARVGRLAEVSVG